MVDERQTTVEDRHNQNGYDICQSRTPPFSAETALNRLCAVCPAKRILLLLLLFRHKHADSHKQKNDQHRKIYLAAGYTDLRRGIDGLATMIRFRFQLDPYDKNTLFLFCGKKTNRIKGLLWEGDGFLLLYKRLDNGAFSWPRSTEEALEISSEQYAMLMQGLEIIPKHPIRPTDNPKRS